MKIICTYMILVFGVIGFLNSQNANPYQPDFRNKDFKAVIKTAKKQLKINPKDSIAHYFIGLSYSNLQEHKSAIKNLEIVKKSGILGPVVLLRLAQSYTAENQVENALMQLETLDSLKYGFYKRLDQSEFDSLRKSERFKTIRENMYKRANPCKFDSNYRKFDFWIGEWNVYSKNQKIAESSITNTNGDCGIYENWRPIGSNGGNSISYYDIEDKKWKQNWVAAGRVSHYEELGQYIDGDMTMIAKGIGSWFRMTWSHNIENDTVRQVQESSTDQGKTWIIAFDGLYKRKEKS